MTTKNLANYLRAGQRATIELALFDRTYTVPAEPPALVAVTMSHLAANPELPEAEINQLVEEAVDAVFGAGTFRQWIVFLPITDISLLLLFVQTGYSWELLEVLQRQAAGETVPEDTDNPPALAEG